jgi:hypothetical protein
MNVQGWDFPVSKKKREKHNAIKNIVGKELRQFYSQFNNNFSFSQCIWAMLPMNIPDQLCPAQERHS